MHVCFGVPSFLGTLPVYFLSPNNESTSRKLSILSKTIITLTSKSQITHFSPHITEYLKISHPNIYFSDKI